MSQILKPSEAKLINDRLITASTFQKTFNVSSSAFYRYNKHIDFPVKYETRAGTRYLLSECETFMLLDHQENHSKTA